MEMTIRTALAILLVGAGMGALLTMIFFVGQIRELKRIISCFPTSEAEIRNSAPQNSGRDALSGAAAVSIPAA
jgi:hypothetical protein